MNKLKAVYGSLIVLGFSFVPAVMQAASFDNPLRANDLFGLISLLISALIKVGAVIIVLYFIFAGFQLVIANGNEAKIKQAKNALLYCTIGAIILLGAQAILVLITSTICSVSPAAC